MSASPTACATGLAITCTEVDVQIKAGSLKTARIFAPQVCRLKRNHLYSKDGEMTGPDLCSPSLRMAGPDKLRRDTVLLYQWNKLLQRRQQSVLCAAWVRNQ
jgi:hypothetical protein